MPDVTFGAGYKAGDARKRRFESGALSGLDAQYGQFRYVIACTHGTVAGRAAFRSLKRSGTSSVCPTTSMATLPRSA
ncbi:hypothetical protein D9M71_805580 [compost metagenome]